MDKKVKEADENFARDRYVEELVRDMQADFEKRRRARLVLERQWELNMNFLAGNQYCDLNSRGEIESEGKTFYWQNRGVFNHIAPIIDSRLAKFSRITPEVSVRPKTDDDKDVAAASLAEKLVSGAFKRCDFEKVTRKVTAWSETCGTGFYKVVWDNASGSKIGEVDGEEVYEGEVSVLPVSPFEIFPDSLYSEDIDDCASVIHARALSVKDVFEKYGVAVEGGKVSVYNLVKSGVYTKEQDVIDDTRLP